MELLDPAILGTKNVLNACLNAKVERVVVVSSGSAILVNPKWPSDLEMDESCWTDIEYAKSIEVSYTLNFIFLLSSMELTFKKVICVVVFIQQWYAISKTVAEVEALEYGKRDDLSVVTICPAFVIGPMLQSIINATSLFLLSYMKGQSRIAIRLF